MFLMRRRLWLMSTMMEHAEHERKSRFFLIFKTDLFKLLIETLLFSHVLYCLPVWGLFILFANSTLLLLLQGGWACVATKLVPDNLE